MSLKRLLLVFFVLLLFSPQESPVSGKLVSDHQAQSSILVQVVRVIDGDTIQVCCVFGDRVTV